MECEQISTNYAAYCFSLDRELMDRPLMLLYYCASRPELHAVKSIHSGGTAMLYYM